VAADLSHIDAELTGEWEAAPAPPQELDETGNQLAAPVIQQKKTDVVFPSPKHGADGD
jgi:hypothetical protein